MHIFLQNNLFETKYDIIHKTNWFTYSIIMLLFNTCQIVKIYLKIIQIDSTLSSLVGFSI